MANQLLPAPARALDANAYAMPGATMTVYASGTMTLIPVYSDAAGTIEATNPVTADGNGVFPQTFVTEDAKVIVRDANEATLWTLDPCPATSGDATGAAGVAFNPTVSVPQTNVQAAIEAVAASVLTGASDFGLGITGNAPTISNIDSTGQASGVFRFTGTSTGTFPTGITASTTGLVAIDRQTAAEAVMVLRAAGGTTTFIRHLAASTWGAWREVISVNQGAAEGDILYRTSAAWTRLAKGTAGQVLQMNSGATAPEWFGGSVGPTATTSGTNVDITGVPSGAKQVVLMLNSISLTTNDIVLIRPRAGGAIVSTGYQTALVGANSGGGIGEFDTTQIRFRTMTSGTFASGMLIFSRVPGGNFWTFTGSGRSGATEYIGWGGGVSLASALEGFAISAAGAGNFDNGAVAMYWS